MVKKTLYFGNPAYLSYKNRQLIIKRPKIIDGVENEIVTIPIEDIALIVIDNSQITITQCLLIALLENKAAVVSCDSTHMPMGMHLPFYGNTLHNERMRLQLEASKPQKKQLWQQTVKAKVLNQAAVLDEYYEVETGNMYVWAEVVKSGDTTNIEARAAEYYWKNMFPEIVPFVRSRERTCPNNLLNYGYAILRSVVARAIVMSGLLPVMGIHHANKYNPYCLADDIMEPYRPVVDALVIEIINRVGEVETLTTDIKAVLMKIPTINVLIAGQKNPLLTAVSITTSSFVKCLTGEVRKIEYPKLILC